MNQIATAYLAHVVECRTSLKCTVRVGNFGILSSLLDLHTKPHCNLNGQDCLKAYLNWDMRTGRLLIHFDRSQISLAQEGRLFPHGYLSIRNRGTLDDELATALNLPNGWTAVRPGRYPLLDGPDFLTVSVPLCPIGRI